MRLPLRALSIFVAAAPLLAASAAHAGPTAWAALGGGATVWKQGAAAKEFRADGSLLFEGGVGTPDRYPVIVGGLFRVSPLLASGGGADMSWLARVCTRGYQVGGFGIAADVGLYARVWGTPSTSHGAQPSQGFAGTLSLGAPLGITLSFHSMVGSDNLLSFGGSLSIDLLRLTLYRETILNWWPNPEVNAHKLPTAGAPLGFHL